MFMIFGFVALFLASVGLYAVMAFSVSRRIREVGIRMALGARAADVVRMIFRQGLIQLAIGMSIGLLIATGIGRTLKVILFQVEPRDPTIFAGVAVVLTLVGLVACLVPARRATQVDPLVALRAECSVHAPGALTGRVRSNRLRLMTPRGLNLNCENNRSSNRRAG